jgi:FixJ family two-component response regulator
MMGFRLVRSAIPPGDRPMSSSAGLPAPSLVYVVDDDSAVLHSTCFLFESAGHRVSSFASGADLLAAFPGPSPAFVLLDQVMPGMDGLEVFGRLRDLDARVPVVLITGHPDPGIRLRARAAGLPVVEKPLVFEGVLELVTTGPGGSRQPWRDEEEPAAGLCGRGGLRGSAQGATAGGHGVRLPCSG